jgi:ferredoxin--NADP+ reductase
MELRELSHSPAVDVIVHPEGFEIDEASQQAINSSKGTRLMVDTLLKYLEAEPTGAEHRIHIHLCQAPVEVLGTDRVEALRTEKTELQGDGTVKGTGEYVVTPVQAVYRAVGYLSSQLPGVPFDHQAGVIVNDKGRVLDIDDAPVPGLYTTGWIKRGPIGLIGHTKSDAAETIACLLADQDSLPRPEVTDPDAILAHLADRGATVIDADGWTRLDAHEQTLGQTAGRERVKVVPREDMIKAALS